MASADEFYGHYFGKRANACFGRTYDAAHLARHPRQKVQQIEVAFAKGGRQTAAAFEVSLGLVAKGNARRFASPASCSAEADGAVCKLESDGGTFRLKGGHGSGMTLQVIGNGLRMEGATFFEAGGAASDDNLFALSPVAWNRCRVARKP
jgi:hypothetical protein